MNLQRFVDAQRNTYADALRELQRGQKTGHWMWFIFPQLRGLGTSENAHFYGLASLAEAIGYLHHDILGARLLECTRAMLVHRGSDARRILGSTDAMKFISCMTLFAEVSGGQSVFEQALKQFAQGRRDARTIQLLDCISDD